MYALEPLFNDEPAADAPIQAMRPDQELVRLGGCIPDLVRLGTSSWNFPGWRGLVYSESSGTRRMAVDGLHAYAKHPLFRTVGVDRNFYRPLTALEFAHFGEQVPNNFKFLIKAPRLITDPFQRHDGGRIVGPNPEFLNVKAARESLFLPMNKGLGDKAGAVVFEFSPWPRGALRNRDLLHVTVEKIGDFFSRLADQDLKRCVLSAEFRNPELLTPRMMRTLKSNGVRPVLGLHPSMPEVRRQISALRWYETEGSAEDSAINDWDFSGALIIRWNQAAHHFFEQTRRDWTPFDRVISPDPATRTLLASLIVRAARSGVPVWAIVNNMAEGCAPLTIRAIAQSIANLWSRADARNFRETAERVAREARQNREASEKDWVLRLTK